MKAIAAKGLLILAVLCAQQALCATQASGATPKASPKVSTAAIEEVVESNDGGYRANAYVVRWQGSRVLVTDPLALSHLAAGDNLNFIVSHHDVAGQRLLNFIVAGVPACRCDAKTLKSAATVAAFDSRAGTGLVEEVLSVVDDGYHFVAYIVQTDGMRVAVTDPLAQSHHVIGESLAFRAMRTSVADHPVMAFSLVPTPDVLAQARRRNASTTSEITGVIQEVLRTNIDGFAYTAYIVESLGSRVVVADTSTAQPHQPGEQISFLSERVANPSGNGAGILSFEPAELGEDKAENISLSSSNETAVVEEVLTAQADGYRFLAYIVELNGARVAVSDVFANTTYGVGDRITFPVSRISSSGGRSLRFLLFDFKNAAAPRRVGDATGSNSKTS
jgi:hypothetical protein